MANVCSNLFFCSTTNAENYKKIEEFLITDFLCDYIDCGDESFIEAVFDSKWSFPESAFEELFSTFVPDDSLYMRVLSYEFGCEYVSYRIYKNGEWDIKI